MRSGRFALTLGVLAVIATAGPAMSQTPLEDPLDARDAKRVDRMEKVIRELRAIVFQLRDTGKPVVVQPADTDARMDELSRRIGDFEGALRGLNSSLESATHDLDQTKRDNAALKAQLATLSERLATAEQKLAAGPAAPAVAEAAPPAAAGDAGKDFAAARQLMLSGDYEAAETAFAAYVANYPDAPRAPEASYWWGKTLAIRNAHAEAARAYITAIRGWPQTSWAPEAVVELAKSLVALKKPVDACQTLAELPRRYPKAPPAINSRAAAMRTQAKCAAVTASR
jgi:tol-pal system protein YbgF